MSTKYRFAFVIPVYNHGDTVGTVVRKAKEFNYPVIVVNDGSTDHTQDQLNKIEGITVLNHSSNIGKGAALKSGFKAAADVADFAISVDADGQHDLSDTPSLMNVLTQDKKSFVVGVRKGMDGENVPWTSRFGRLFSNFWVFVSGGPWLHDTQSGFRIYPLPETCRLKTVGQRYQYEVEVLVKANWIKMPILEVPINVHYQPGLKRVSHFKPFIDFMRNSSIFTRLISQRILIPAPLRRKLTFNHRNHISFS